MSKKQQLKSMEKRLAEMKAHCKKCDRWECGHCGEPKYDLENAIYDLKKEIEGGAA